MYENKAFSVQGPAAATVAGQDEIYVDTEIAYQANGHSVGNIQISVLRSNDAYGAGLVVKANINDDANAYTKPPSTERFAAVKIRIEYYFKFVLQGDFIYIDDIVLYGDGTYSRQRRETQ